MGDETQKQVKLFFRLKVVKFLPAFLAIAGVACLELGGENPSPSVGDSLALVQPIVWGWSYVLLEKVLKE